MVVGGGAVNIKGGRHIVYPEGTPLTNLHVTLLDKVGVPVEKLGDSTGKFNELLGDSRRNFSCADRVMGGNVTKRTAILLVLSCGAAHSSGNERSGRRNDQRLCA